MKRIAVLLFTCLLLIGGGHEQNRPILPEQANDRAKDVIDELFYEDVPVIEPAPQAPAQQRQPQQARPEPAATQPQERARESRTRNFVEGLDPSPVPEPKETVTEIKVIEVPGDTVIKTQRVTRTRFVDSVPYWIWIIVGAITGMALSAFYLMVKYRRKFDEFKQQIREEFGIQTLTDSDGSDMLDEHGHLAE